MAVAGGFQVRQEGLGAVHHAPEVDVHDPLVLGVVAAFDGAGVSDAGVVEDQVDLAELAYHLIGPGMHSSTVGDIDHGFQHLHTVLARGLGGFLEAGGVDVGDGQVAALAGQVQRQGAADAGAGAGDGRHFVDKGIHARASSAFSTGLVWAAGACSSKGLPTRLK